MEKHFSNAERAEVLTQALPYIKQYNGKIVVIKYGGNAMVNEQLKQQVMEDIVLLWLIGVKVVLVHGGGPEISETMQKLGKKAVFVDGLRVTDRETVDIVQMVLAGKINKTLVNLLEMHGGQAMGISGMDGRLIEARIKDERLGFVGEITNVNVQPILDVIEKGYIPVISTVACDKKGNIYNINGDLHEAAAIDGANRWQRLTHITLPGILPMIMMMFTLKIGLVFREGFDKVLLLYMPLTYDTADCLHTYTYRMAFGGMPDYSLSTASGLFQSVIATALLVFSNWANKKATGYALY